MAMWIQIFQLVPGDLIKLRRRAHQWMKECTGFTAEQEEDVQNTRDVSQRRRELRERQSLVDDS